eukprot:sb/3463221/
MAILFVPPILVFIFWRMFPVGELLLRKGNQTVLAVSLPKQPIMTSYLGHVTGYQPISRNSIHWVEIQLTFSNTFLILGYTPALFLGRIQYTRSIFPCDFCRISLQTFSTSFSLRYFTREGWAICIPLSRPTLISMSQKAWGMSEKYVQSDPDLVTSSGERVLVTKLGWALNRGALNRGPTVPYLYQFSFNALIELDERVFHLRSNILDNKAVGSSKVGQEVIKEPTETSKQPIRTRYLGHVTGYQPIRDQYLLTYSLRLGRLQVLQLHTLCRDTVYILKHILNPWVNTSTVPRQNTINKVNLSLGFLQDLPTNILDLILPEVLHKRGLGYLHTVISAHLDQHVTEGLGNERERILVVFHLLELPIGTLLPDSGFLGCGSDHAGSLGGVEFPDTSLTLYNVAHLGGGKRGGVRGMELEGGVSYLGVYLLFDFGFGVWAVAGSSKVGQEVIKEPTETSKQPIRTRYLGHVTGYQPIRDQYLLTYSLRLGRLQVLQLHTLCRDTVYILKHILNPWVNTSTVPRQNTINKVNLSLGFLQDLPTNILDLILPEVLHKRGLGYLHTVISAHLDQHVTEGLGNERVSNESVTSWYIFCICLLFH